MATPTSQNADVIRVLQDVSNQIASSISKLENARNKNASLNNGVSSNIRSAIKDLRSVRDVYIKDSVAILKL